MKIKKNLIMYFVLYTTISFATVPLMAAASSLADDEPISRVPSLQSLALRSGADCYVRNKFFEPEWPSLTAFLKSFILKQDVAFAIPDGITKEDLVRVVSNDRKILDFQKPLLIEAMAKAIAKEYFLRMPAEERVPFLRSPDRLPLWLQPYFAGVSIQDLLNKGLIDRVKWGSVDGLDPVSAGMSLVYSLSESYTRPSIYASYMYINDSKGFENLPDKAGIQYIYLKRNRIENFVPGVFLPFKNLKQIDLSGNPIDGNLRERRRIESEIRTATNGQGTVFWGH